MTRTRPNYREIIRLYAEKLSQNEIARSSGSSKRTVNRVLRLAKEHNIQWPLSEDQTNDELARIFSTPAKKSPARRHLPDFDRIHEELCRNGVNKKLLWTEYLENCRLRGEQGLMYSQFCYYIQQDEAKRHATMHFRHKPGEQIEVDWAGDPAYYVDRDTGEKIKAYVFIGVLPYSQYTFAKAYANEKQHAWLQGHIDMFAFFGGVAKMLIPDNCSTAVTHRGSSWYSPRVNLSYHELAEHYGTAIIPARVRHPKDKPSAEGTVSHISTWIIAALRNRQFFSLEDLNASIAENLDTLNRKPFQKREGCRLDVFEQEERLYLAPLPIIPYELADWLSVRVQYNYHVQVLGMYYSVPFEYIHKTVDVRVTDHAIQIYYQHKRIATHQRVYGSKGQYCTVKEHMPENHRKYLEWNSDRFCSWASTIGPFTEKVVAGILSTYVIEQQGYRACMGLIHLAEKYSSPALESACEKALTYSTRPTYNNVKSLLAVQSAKAAKAQRDNGKPNPHGLTRGAAYFRRDS